MLQKTHNTLSGNIRGHSVELLNRYLAAAVDLHAQVKQAHWNVRGPAFIAVHELFDKVADEVDAYADKLAERAAALGGVAHGTVQAAVKDTFLKPYKLGIASEKEHIEAVATALAAYSGSVREAIKQADEQGDPTTADLLTEISRGLDQQVWLVESHAARKNAA